MDKFQKKIEIEKPDELTQFWLDLQNSIGGKKMQFMSTGGVLQELDRVAIDISAGLLIFHPKLQTGQKRDNENAFKLPFVRLDTRAIMSQDGEILIHAGREVVRLSVIPSKRS